MPDTTMSEALEEAYASAPSSDIVIHTLSIYYEGLENDIGQPTELYIYQGMQGDRQTTEGVWLKDFRIEGTAERHAGEVREFIGLPFEIKLPDIATQPTAKGQLLIDGVGREVADLLIEAIGLGVSIQCTYRAYLESGAMVGPAQLPPIPFGFSNVSIGGLQVVGDIVVPTLGHRKFPGRVYTPQEFPTLFT